MVVTVGLAITLAPLTVLSPVDGDHEYVFAPLAVSVMLDPLQIVAVDGDTLTVGLAFTVTIIVLVPVQLLLPVPVTV